MCGHVGTAGNLAFKDEAMMKRMLILDYFRGPDSTGLAAVRKHESEIKIAKVASNPIDLFDTKSFSSALTGASSKVLIGHNRAATKGKVNRQNAHPFEFEHIVGCHNGTLDNASWVELEDYIEEKFEVDSAAIISGIATHGIENVIPKLSGAWALVWYNQLEDTMNFIKNDQRPLWWAMSEDFKQIFWASEHWMMDVGLLKTGPLVDKYKLHTNKEGFCFFPFDNDTLYSFAVGDLVTGAYKSLPDPRVKEIEGAPKKVTSVTKYYPSGGQEDDPFKMTAGKTGTGATTSHVAFDGPATAEVVSLSVTKFDPYGAYLTKDEFTAIASYGCSWCGADVSYDQEGCWVYANDDVVLCPSCAPADEKENKAITRVFV